MTIFLPDVSAHQRGLQLEPGTVAVLAKATEGSTYADPGYAGFKAQAAKVDAVFGAYHFLWSGTPAEAAWAFRHVGKTPLMVDAENPKVKTTVAMILSFVAEYRKLGGVVHLVYLPHWYWQELGSPDLTPFTKARLRLVSSNYASYSDTGPGWQPYGGVTPVQWQYTDQFGYGGQRVDFNAFKGTVGQYMNILRYGRLTAPKKRVTPVRVDVAHISMQYSDPPTMQASDAEKVFARARARDVWWVTGTEANQASDTVNFRKGAEAHGYTFYHLGGDVWVGLDLARVDGPVNGPVNVSWVQVIPGKAGSYPTRGVLRVTFTNSEIGRIIILAAHYNLSGPRHPHAQGAKQNPLIAAEIGRQAKLYGAGNGLVFFGGDMNMHVAAADPFFGEPLTAAQTELKKFDPTHPGGECIDVIASYDPDTRVKAAYVRALDDTKVKLGTDHFLVEAGYDVQPLSKRRKR